jgi:hypothetical protein
MLALSEHVHRFFSVGTRLYAFFGVAFFGVAFLAAAVFFLGAAFLAAG